MDDYVGAVAAAVAPYLRRKQRIKTIAQWAIALGLLDEEDAIMSQNDRRTYYVAFATCRIVTSSIHIMCCWGPLARRCLNGTLWPASSILWLCKSHTIEDDVLCHATVISRCTRR